MAWGCPRSIHRELSPGCRLTAELWRARPTKLSKSRRTQPCLTPSQSLVERKKTPPKLERRNDGIVKSLSILGHFLVIHLSNVCGAIPQWRFTLRNASDSVLRGRIPKASTAGCSVNTARLNREDRCRSAVALCRDAEATIYLHNRQRCWYGNLFRVCCDIQGGRRLQRHRAEIGEKVR